MLIHKSRDVFSTRFEKKPDLMVQAPGCLNIMGEHTDLYEGFVLPAAIDLCMYMAFAKNGTQTCNIYAIDLHEEASFNLEELIADDRNWLNLIKGVVHQLQDQLQGFDLAFCGDIPSGAGLSSSAAICCGVGFGLCELFNLDIKKWDLAKIAQKSEHDFAGVQCGIMDQFGSLFGLTNHLLVLDCLNLTFTESEVDTTGYKFLLLDSNIVHHSNAATYQERRSDSFRALDKLKIMNPQVKTYRDVSSEMIDKLPIDEVLKNRARHIISENDRVQAVSRALKRHKMESLGKLLNEGHESLKKNYEVTCEQTDFLHHILNEEQTVLGGRQVGSGFGGCILSIVKDQGIDALVARINAKYKKKYGEEVTRIPLRISRGCHVVQDVL